MNRINRPNIDKIYPNFKWSERIEKMISRTFYHYHVLKINEETIENIIRDQWELLIPNSIKYTLTSNSPHRSMEEAKKLLIDNELDHLMYINNLNSVVILTTNPLNWQIKKLIICMNEGNYLNYIFLCNTLITELKTNHLD